MNRIEYDYYKIYPSREGVYHDEDKIVAMNIFELQATMRWIKECGEYDGYIVIGHIREYQMDEIVCRGDLERIQTKKGKKK